MLMIISKQDLPRVTDRILLSAACVKRRTLEKKSVLHAGQTVVFPRTAATGVRTPCFLRVWEDKPRAVVAANGGTRQSRQI